MPAIRIGALDNEYVEVAEWAKANGCMEGESSGSDSDSDNDWESAGE